LVKANPSVVVSICVVDATSSVVVTNVAAAVVVAAAFFVVVASVAVVVVVVDKSAVDNVVVVVVVGFEDGDVNFCVVFCVLVEVVGVAMTLFTANHVESGGRLVSVVGRLLSWLCPRPPAI
jgi:hypothetical protein